MITNKKKDRDMYLEFNESAQNSRFFPIGRVLSVCLTPDRALIRLQSDQTDTVNGDFSDIVDSLKNLSNFIEVKVKHPDTREFINLDAFHSFSVNVQDNRYVLSTCLHRDVYSSRNTNGTHEIFEEQFKKLKSNVSITGKLKSVVLA